MGSGYPGVDNSALGNTNKFRIVAITSLNMIRLKNWKLITQLLGDTNIVINTDLEIMKLKFYKDRLIWLIIFFYQRKSNTNWQIPWEDCPNLLEYPFKIHCMDCCLSIDHSLYCIPIHQLRQQKKKVWTTALLITFCLQHTVLHWFMLIWYTI